MRFLDLQGGEGSTIKRLTAPPPLLKSVCFVSGRSTMVESSWASICSYWTLRYGAKTAEATKRQMQGLEQQGMLLERLGQFSRSDNLPKSV